MVCQQITVKSSKNANLNLVQSLAIKLSHTLRRNLQFTKKNVKSLAIVYIRTSFRVHCYIDKVTKQFDCLICTKIMALTLTPIFSFQSWRIEQETGMVFCYLYELFWEMHLLFCKCWRWFEKCTKAT